MKKILAVILMTLSTLALADQGDISVRLSTVSYHFKNNSSQNNNNFGLAVGYEFYKDVIASVGVFENSIKEGNGGRTSEFVSMEYRAYHDGVYSVYGRLRYANNYKTRSYNHEWKTQANIDGCRKLMSTKVDGCVSYGFWNQGDVQPTLSLQFRTVF